MGTNWKESLLGGRDLPDGYGRHGDIIGRDALLSASEDRMFSGSEFVGRAQVPHTTSAVEATIRRRHLERLVELAGIDTAGTALELGCADGLVTRHLLALGFEQLVSTDIDPELAGKLAASLDEPDRDRVLLMVDDLHQMPFEAASFSTVIAWGVLSVSGDVERAIGLSWDWLEPGGHLIFAEPILESILAYALVRGDLEEFRRIQSEGTRAAVWEQRNDGGARYEVKPLRYYEERLAGLSGAEVIERGGISMLPSLVLGGIAQDQRLEDSELEELSDLLEGESLDGLALWRQAYWLVRKA